MPYDIPVREDGRTLVMGVLNVTPDSFSDGGEYLAPADAVARGQELIAQGADIVDIGGESTRPGATRVSTAEEIDRTISVVSGLRDQGAVISIDTMRAEVARLAVENGAGIVNDVSGGLADEAMLETVAELNVPYVIMHWRAHSEQMEQFTHYDDVVTEVCEHLATRAQAAQAVGVKNSKIIVDPGLGFAKRPEHNWKLLRHFDDLKKMGHPILVGASRKRFLRNAVSEPGAKPREFDDLAAATDAVSALTAHAGAWAVRVHDVPGTIDAVTIANYL
ncbi:MAG: dihydropteroate synthase [Candidatus Nanopelagicales bacterium]